MKELYQRYGSLFVISITLYLSYVIAKPFLLTLLSSAIVAYLFYPIYRFLSEKTKRKTVSAALTCLLAVLMLFLPGIYLVNSMFTELPEIYSSVTSILKDSDAINVISGLELPVDINSLIDSGAKSALTYGKNLIASLPEKIVNFILAIVFVFFLLRDGEKLISELLHFLPFTKKDMVILIRQLKGMTDAVIYGQTVTAFVQSIAATIAYFILGIDSPIFWGIITFIFALIPLIGPSIVYMPLSAGLIISGLTLNDNVPVIKGAILLVYGLAGISSIDNIIKPILISDKVKMHPMIILIGTLGGLYAFGVIGIIAGPLILVFLVTIFNIYEMKEKITDNIEHHKKG